MKSILPFFLIFAGLNMQAQQSSYLSEIVVKWDNARKYTLEIAEAMPDSNYNFSPVKEEMSFAHQLAHLGENMMWLSSTYLSKSKPPFDKIKYDSVTKKEIIEQLKATFDFASTQLKNLTPEKLEEKVDFFAGKMIKRQIVNLMNDHLTHHNAQCIVYLRLKGLKPLQYIGW